MTLVQGGDQLGEPGKEPWDTQNNIEAELATSCLQGDRGPAWTLDWPSRSLKSLGTGKCRRVACWQRSVRETSWRRRHPEIINADEIRCIQGGVTVDEIM